MLTKTHARRAFLRLYALAMAGILTGLAPNVAWAANDKDAPGVMTVYKSPSCGCCAKWVEYLRRDGFKVTVEDGANMQTVKAYYGVAPKMASCHTAIIDGYVIEGHVPSADIRRLLRERPPVLGLTAPGMPQMSPGMHSEIPRDYDVLTFDKKGRLNLFSRY